MSQNERPAPDLAAAGVKLWKSVRDFSRAVTANLEDSWGQATTARPAPKSSGNKAFVEIPRVLWDDVAEALDDPAVARLLPGAVVKPLTDIKSYVDQRGR